MRRAINLARSSLLSRFSIPLWPDWCRVSSEPYSQVAENEASAARLLVVQPRVRPESALQSKLAEAVSLANSLEEQRDGVFDVDISQKEIPQHVLVQNPSARGHKAHADTYFGKGTVETVKIHLNHVESKGDIDAVFVNAMLTGVQQRNLERAWAKPVLDRVGLIIEIFNAHANTKEGKLQAELAALTYKKSRLVRVRSSDGRHTFGVDGEVEVVSARGRGSGGRGFIGGAGETEIHLQRRRISERRRILLGQIEEVRRTRALQRASRKRHGGTHGCGLATVAIVGYTNAGKSTLVSALSDSPLFSDSRLFATVDPRLRDVVLPSGRKVLFSDTVGFISDLPVQLVEAFHATLEEVVEADLLVHVLDSTAPNLDEHRATVVRVLEQIGVSKEKLENMIEVWNKIDRQDRHVDGDEHLDDNKASNYMESFGTVEEPVDDEDALESVDQDDQEDGHFDEWPESEVDQSVPNDEDGCSIPMKSIATVPQKELSKDDLLCYRDRSCPDVKTSALKRIGLQELLELVDERLSDQVEKSRPEMNVFHRKWRPSCEEDSQVAT